MPAHAGAGPERVGDLRLGPQRAQREQERARQVQRPVRVGQRERLLLGQREPPGGGIAADVPARRLPAQPLRDVPRVGSGPPRQLLRGGRPLGQAAVQAQAVPDDDVPGRDGGAQVADEPAEQLAELVLIDGHDGPLSLGRAPASPRARLRLRQRSVNQRAPQVYNERVLQVRLLGGVAADHDGEQLSLLPPVSRLLAVLALRPGPQDRETVAATLWPGAAGPAARANLRTAVWALRKAVGDDALITSRTAVGLRPEAITVDLADGQRARRRGRRRRRGRAVPRRAAARVRRGLGRDGPAAAAGRAGRDAGRPVRGRRARRRRGRRGALVPAALRARPAERGGPRRPGPAARRGRRPGRGPGRRARGDRPAARGARRAARAVAARGAGRGARSRGPRRRPVPAGPGPGASGPGRCTGGPPSSAR